MTTKPPLYYYYYYYYYYYCNSHIQSLMIGEWQLLLDDMMVAPKLSPEERLAKEKGAILSYLEELADAASTTSTTGGGSSSMDTTPVAQITHQVMDRLNLSDDLQVRHDNTMGMVTPPPFLFGREVEKDLREGYGTHVEAWVVMQFAQVEEVVRSLKLQVQVKRQRQEHSGDDNKVGSGSTTTAVGVADHLRDHHYMLE